MKTNEVFLKAKKDRNLRNMLIIDRIDEVTNSRRQLIRLCVDLKKKYSSDLIPETEFIECDTEIRYENYSYMDNGVKRENFNTCFFTDCAYYPHVHTFLNDIKKDSDISFKIVAFNNNDNFRNANFVHHTLYGIIDNKRYYLLC